MAIWTRHPIPRPTVKSILLFPRPPNQLLVPSTHVDEILVSKPYIPPIHTESPSTLAKLRDRGAGREMTVTEAEEDRKRVYMLRMALL